MWSGSSPVYAGDAAFTSLLFVPVAPEVPAYCSRGGKRISEAGLVVEQCVPYSPNLC